MDGEGGPWTEVKLKKVHEYLVAYQNVMLKQNWVRTVYIDAFCGSGAVKLRGAREFTVGSALQAIGLERPFHEYHLIEKSQQSLRRLQDQVARKFPEQLSKVHFHQGDVNELLPQVVAGVTGSQRCVVFADPYGMQLDFSTVEAVAANPRCDFWLLVPTGIGLTRLATRDSRRRPASWEARLDRFLGEKDWRTRWYKPIGQTELFGNPEEEARVASLSAMTRDFQNRLQSVFPCVAENVLHLGDGKLVLFTLMFACSNPSPAAQAAAKRIANHLLRS